VRRHDSNIDLSLNIAHRDLHDNLNAVSVFNPRTADVGAATLQRTRFSTVFKHRFYTRTAATVTVGEMNLEDAAAIASTGTNGDYSKLVVNLSAETPLHGALSGRVTAVGQKDLRVKTLDSSEQFFISGPAGARAFAEGMSGDNGYIFNLELPYALPKIPAIGGFQHTLSAFFDSGGVEAEKNGTSQTDFVVNDVGAGYTATRSPFYLKVQGVRILGNIHSETRKTPIWLQLGVVF
jgi:hemolysin activation/secretion protein